MNYKVLALGIALGFAVALAPSCGPAKCSAANCNGCCSSDNTCVETASQNGTQCGASGAACAACTGTQVCTAGVCQNTTGCTGSNCTDAGTDGGMNQGCSAATCPNGCCAAGGICLQGKSFTNCGSGGGACSTCGASQTCSPVSNGGACQTMAAPDAGNIGKGCTMASDCADPSLPNMGCRTQTSSGNATYNGGFCTFECNAQNMCPTGSVCLGTTSYGENPICTPNCSASNPCRSPGYTCYQLQSGGSACWLDPLPTVDAGPPAPDNLIGSACMADQDCQAGGAFDKGFCQPGTETDGGPSGWTNGYCFGDCSFGNICGNTAECFQLGSGSSTALVCLDLCNDPAQGQGDPADGGCRTGYICDTYSVGLPDGGSQPATNGVCWPSCNAPGWGCGQGQTCNAQGYCQ